MSFIPLDWHRLRAEMQPHLEGQGGVLHVMASAGDSPQTLVSVLRSVWLSQASPRWSCLPVDALDDTLKYPSGLLRGILDVAGLTSPESHDQTLNIAPDARVKGDLHVRDLHIDIRGGSTTSISAEQIESAVTQLRGHLAGARLAIVHTDMHELEVNERKRTFKTLWQDRLESLVPDGLLLVAVFDPARMQWDDGCGYPPPPTKTILMSDYYRTSEDKDRALKDLVSHSLSVGWHDDESLATEFARTVVHMSTSMRELQANVARWRYSTGGA